MHSKLKNLVLFTIFPLFVCQFSFGAIDIGNRIRIHGKTGRPVEAVVREIGNSYFLVTWDENGATHSDKVSIQTVNRLNPHGPLPARELVIFARTLEGRIITTYSDEMKLRTMTVRDFKNKIGQVLNKNNDLFFVMKRSQDGGQILFDEDLLSDYGVQNETFLVIVELIGRPMGSFSGHRPKEGEVRYEIVFARTPGFNGVNANPHQDRIGTLKEKVSKATGIPVQQIQFSTEQTAANTMVILDDDDMLLKDCNFRADVTQPIIYLNLLSKDQVEHKEEARASGQHATLHEQKMNSELGRFLRTVGIENLSCGICMVEHEVGKPIVKLDCQCAVGYCSPCITRWRAQKNTCPVCRKDITGSSEFIPSSSSSSSSGPIR